jgi:hypothetical protein
MGKRQKAWAKRARARLMQQLIERCNQCGARYDLVFDCVKACGDEHHRMESSNRMSFYHRQHAAGNLQVLCRACNTAKSTGELILSLTALKP